MSRPNVIEIDNGRVRARFVIGAAGVDQEFYARAGDGWKRVATAVRPPRPFPAQAARLYDSSVGTANRLLVPETLTAARVERRGPDRARVRLTGRQGEHRVAQTVEIARDAGHLRIEVRVTLAGTPPRLEYALSPFAFAAAGTPDVTHVPALKRTADDVIGDRVFFSPAAFVQKDGLFAALVPDLDRINSDIVQAKGGRPQTHPKVFRVPGDHPASLPTVLDLNLQSGLADGALLACGMMDVLAEQHVFWKHESGPGRLVREVSRREIAYGMDLFLAADAPPHRGYARLAPFLWERYGAPRFRRPRPQAMPFADYARVCYPAAFRYAGYTIADDHQTLIHRDPERQPDQQAWRQWEADGASLGAVRLSAPQWSHLTSNSPWWNNVADALGYHYWGRALNDPALLDRARRCVRFALSAPQRDGLFPSVYDLERHRWLGSFWRLPLRDYDPDATRTYWDWQNGMYQTVAASVTAGYLLEYRRHCEEAPGLLEYVRRYGDFLLAHVQPDGCVPAWFDDDLTPAPSLRWNADGGAHIWTLCGLYRATHDRRYLEGAERMARFLMREVLPGQRWSDFEAYYSCAVKRETYRDPLTGQPARCTMSMLWALQGLNALYEATHVAEYLDAAQAVADYASLFQTVWSPHYIITADPFGGFSSQVGDAEWLDQRGHRLACALVETGLLAGRQDLLERGVAAARASLTLVNHPRHLSNGIYMHPNYPLGLGPENIDHEGFPQMPLRSGASWCEVGGLMAAAELLRQLGSAYVDTQRHLAVGVDGLAVRAVHADGQGVRVELANLLAMLPDPYRTPYAATVRIARPAGVADMPITVECATTATVSTGEKP